MNREKTVFGQSLPAPRLTPLGAALMALLVALPCGVLLSVVEWLLF